METIYLKTLVEAVNTGSLSRAAESLCITPSTASRRLKFMEEQYGHELLDRSGPVMVPTPAGSIVLQKAQEMLAIEHEILMGLKGLNHDTGILFCCTNAFGIAHLPRIFAEFMSNNPDTSNLKFFFGQPDDIVRGLRGSDYTMAVFEHCIHCECFRFDEFATYELPRDEMIFVSSPGLAVSPAQLTIDELFRHTLYGQNEENCASKFLATNVRTMGRDIYEFSNHVIVDDLHMIINAVLEGNGIACISRGVVEKHLTSGRLVAHHVEGFEHQRKRTLAIATDKKSNPATRELKNCILDYFR